MEKLIMRGINKVILIGNLGDEPAIRSTNNGTKVANANLCTNESYVDRNGQKVESSEWHRLVIWGKLADVVAQYVHKGQQLYIEGKLATRKYQDKNGQDRTITEIVVQELQMLGSANSAKQGTTTQAHTNTQANVNAYNGQAQNANPNMYQGQAVQATPVYGNQPQAQAPQAPNGYYMPPQTQNAQNGVLDDHLPF